MAEATNPIPTASNPRVGEDVGREDLRHEATFLLARLRDFESELTDEQARDWYGHVTPSMERLHALASAPSPEAGAGGDLGELERLSKAATQGEWRSAKRVVDGRRRVAAAGVSPSNGRDENVPWVGLASFIVEVEGRDTSSGHANIDFAVASVNYVREMIRSGKLVASTGSGKEETKGEPSGTGYSSETTPSGRGASREYPSRGWQPIATAPKDGKPILAVWAGYVPVCAHWLPEHERWLTFAPDEFDSKKDLEDHLAATMYKPTHWMPLPEGPALGTEARSAETFGLGPKDDGPACKATPEATPKSSPSQTPVDPQMTVGEARDVLSDLEPSISPSEAANRMRDIASWYRGTAAAQGFIEHADRIELALRTLQAADAPSTTEADQ